MATRRADALTALLPLLLRGWRYVWRDYLQSSRFWFDLLGAFILLHFSQPLLPPIVTDSFALLPEESQALVAIGLATLVGAGIGLATLGGSIRYVQMLTAYEGLRSSVRPGANALIRVVLFCPITVYAVWLTSLAITIWMFARVFEIGSELPLHEVLERTRWLFVSMVPPLAEFLRQVGWLSEARSLGWLDFVFSLGVFPLVVYHLRVWVNFRIQRFDTFLALCKPRASGAPYGYSRVVDGHMSPEPHEQVLLMQSERIGADALRYLAVQIFSCPPDQEAVDNRDPWGILAATQRIFAHHGLRCWKRHPSICADLLAWTLRYIQTLQRGLETRSHKLNPHRVAVAIIAVGEILGTALKHAPQSVDLGLEQRAKDYRGSLRKLFPLSSGQPAVFMACCKAAEQLGSPEDIALLESQIRYLNVQAGYSKEETDEILETRDRLCSRPEVKLRRRRELLKHILSLGLELENDPERVNTVIFRRPFDSARMAWIEGGSFVRGDDSFPESSPARRVCLSDYLIDLEPVSNEAFQRFFHNRGSVLCLDRGFFPVQNTSSAQQMGPALYVTWYAAQLYACHVIRGGHLPTEAQWEKAARGSARAIRYPTGDQWSEPPVSAYGIRICHILEWCRDAFDEKAYSINPKVFDPWMDAPENASEVKRVIRGRDASHPIDEFFLSRRLAGDPIEEGLSLPVGFRVAIEVPSC
ncbi:MAG: formylglycine-generating enzyme family protein [Thermoguttaceae bacterium]|nr:formylglycine-generating enzyme family protein [Thermoguttaceae bacterium]